MDFTRYPELKKEGTIELRPITEGSPEVLIIKKKWDGDTGKTLSNETIIANQVTAKSLNDKKEQMEKQIAQVQKQIAGVEAFLEDYKKLITPEEIPV